MSLMAGWPERRPEPAARRQRPWGALALLALTGIFLIRTGLPDRPGGPPRPGPTHAAPAGPAPAAAPLPRSVPDRVVIPALQVSAPVIARGLDAHGAIEAPPSADTRVTGWYRDAPTPGERGTAVLVGHVDSYTGPAVFYGLGGLKRGATVEVRRRDGRRAVFAVYAVRTFAKDRFPAEQVYGATGRPELRLLTCGGSYHAGSGYAGNVVVFARLVAPRGGHPAAGAP
ncbi:class F sortase [Streptomyces sp. NPDC014733]|uniref:class F sortase n=1 Tax=Streptomyces sp. NPDC014733 TaxID=3364885 RepID=UPI0036F6B5DB